MTLSIRTKLFLGFGIVFFCVSVLGGVGWWCVTLLLSNLQTLNDNNVQAAVQLGKAQNALWQLRYGFPQFIVLGEEERKKIVADEAKWYKQIEEAMQAYEASGRPPEEQKTLQEWKEVFSNYVQARPRWFELQGAGKIEDAVEWRAKTTTPYGAGAVKALGQLIELQQQEGAAQYQAAITVAERGRRMQFGILGATLLVSLAVA